MLFPTWLNDASRMLFGILSKPHKCCFPHGSSETIHACSKVMTNTRYPVAIQSPSNRFKDAPVSPILFLALYNINMTETFDVVAFLHRTEDVNQLMRQLSEQVSTRSMWQRLTTSCRKWQLVLLCLLHTYPRRLDLVPRVKAILHAILQQSESESPTPLHALIVRNRPSPDDVFPVSTLDDVAWSDTSRATCRVACFCLYIADYPTLRRPDGCILHYFTLLQCANRRVYLNSSYASDYVCVSQCTRAVSRRAFDAFCVAIDDPRRRESEVRAFFAAFFIPRRMVQTRVEHETERDHQTQSLDARIESEIQVYTRNLYKIAVGQLSQYSHHIKDIACSLDHASCG